MALSKKDRESEILRLTALIEKAKTDLDVLQRYGQFEAEWEASRKANDGGGLDMFQSTETQSGEVDSAVRAACCLRIGHFNFKDIRRDLEAQGKSYNDSSIKAVLFRMRTTGTLKEVVKGLGRRAAAFENVQESPVGAKLPIPSAHQGDASGSMALAASAVLSHKTAL